MIGESALGLGHILGSQGVKEVVLSGYWEVI